MLFEALNLLYIRHQIRERTTESNTSSERAREWDVSRTAIGIFDTSLIVESGVDITLVSTGTRNHSSSFNSCQGLPH